MAGQSARGHEAHGRSQTSLPEFNHALMGIAGDCMLQTLIGILLASLQAGNKATKSNLASNVALGHLSPVNKPSAPKATGVAGIGTGQGIKSGHGLGSPADFVQIITPLMHRVFAT